MYICIFTQANIRIYIHIYVSFNRQASFHSLYGSRQVGRRQTSSPALHCLAATPWISQASRPSRPSLRGPLSPSLTVC